MSDLPCNLNLLLDATFGQEQVQFRTDVLLPQPILLAPIDNAHICLTASRNSTSHIALAWTAVTGATNYVLQWGENEDLSSQGSRQVLLAATAFTLVRNRDIRLGQTIYWRVFAVNLSGGVSLPSQTRQLMYTCPETSDGQPTKEATFNVEAELLGPDTIRSCEDTTYYVKLSFTSRDAEFREIARYISTTWTAEYIGSANGNSDITNPPDNDLKASINTQINGTSSGNLKITADVLFLDVIKNEPFNKQLTKEVISEPFGFGCGLICSEVCVDDDPTKTTKKVGIDFNAIVGDGLAVKEPIGLDPENPDETCDCPKLELDPNTGCGISFEVIDPEDPLSGKELAIKLEDILPQTTYIWDDQDCDNTSYQTYCTENTDAVAIVQGRVWYDPSLEAGEDEECPKQIFAEVNIPLECPLINGAGGITVEVPSGSFPPPLIIPKIVGSNVVSESNVEKAVAWGTVLYNKETEDSCGEWITKTYLPFDCYFDATGGKIKLNLAALAGDGLSVDDEGECPKLKAVGVAYTAGCGIEIVEETISINYAAIADEGSYAWNSSGCSDVQFNVLIGCNVDSGQLGGVAELQGRLRYDYPTSGPIPCDKLFSNVHLPYDCSLKLNGSALGLNYDIFDRGLAVLGGTCPVKVGLCVEDAELPIPFDQMTGSDLTSTGSTGIKAIIYGQVHYDPTPYPLPPSDEESPSEEGSPSEGGSPEEPPNQPCKVFTRSYLPVGCNFDVDGDKLNLNVNTLVGKGLTLGGDADCTGLAICAKNGSSEVTTEDLTGTDLTDTDTKALLYGEVFHEADTGENPGCGRLVTKTLLPVDCHFNLSNGKLEINLTSLAGSGIGVSDDECPKLEVDLQDLLCDVPTVTPTTSDFVLGLRYNEEGCELVKYAITECPDDEDGGGGGGGGDPPPP